MSSGNLICQLITYEKNKKIDYFQIIQYGSFGLLISGPILRWHARIYAKCKNIKIKLFQFRYWWYALDLKVFKNPNTFLRPVKMMLLDQVINLTF